MTHCPFRFGERITYRCEEWQPPTDPLSDEEESLPLEPGTIELDEVGGVSEDKTNRA